MKFLIWVDPAFSVGTLGWVSTFCWPPNFPLGIVCFSLRIQRACPRNPGFLSRIFLFDLGIGVGTLNPMRNREVELDSERAWVWFRTFPGFIKCRGIPEIP